MNLTLFFTVLSIGIGYLLYDMFRKSKLKILVKVTNDENKK